MKINDYNKNYYNEDSDIIKVLDLTYKIGEFIGNVDIKKACDIYNETFSNINMLSKNLERDDGKLNVGIKQNNKYINLYDFLLNDPNMNDIDKDDLEKKLKIILSTVAYFYSMDKQKILDNLMYMYAYYKYQGDCILNSKRGDINGIVVLSKNSTIGLRLSNFNTFKKSDLNVNFRSYLIGLLLALQFKGNMYGNGVDKILSSNFFNLLKELLKKYNKCVKLTKKDFENNSFLQKYLSENIPIVDIVNCLEDEIKEKQLNKFTYNTKNSILKKAA